LQALDFAFSVFPCVLDPYVMGLQEAVELVAGFDAEQFLEFGLRYTIMLVPFGRVGFQNLARQTLPSVSVSLNNLAPSSSWLLGS
jgi:hypothetical protein